MRFARSLVPLVIAAGLATACTASVQPVVEDTNAIRDDRLVGAWAAPEGEQAFVIAAPGLAYDIRYVEKGKQGKFIAHLGRIGGHLVLDVSPEDPAPDAADLYRTMLLRTHGIVVLDSIGAILSMRMLRPDSLKAFLTRTPNAVQHTTVDDWLLITSSSADTRRFLAEYLARPGVLDSGSVWKRAPLPAVAVGTATVRIASGAPGAALYVNGKIENLIAAARDVTVPAGEVRLTIRSQSCQPWDTVMHVTANVKYAIGRRPGRC